jgi:hypothetical protein
MRRLSFLTSQEEQEGGKEEDSRQSIGSITKNTTFSSSFSSSYSSSSSKRKPPQELSQLYLDPFTCSSNSTLHCSICSLSYSRTPQDLNFHTKHHKKIVSGIDWTNSGGITTIKGVTLLQDEIEIKGKGKGKDDLEGKVLMCDWSIVENPIKKRVSPLSLSISIVSKTELIC